MSSARQAGDDDDGLRRLPGLPRGRGGVAIRVLLECLHRKRRCDMGYLAVMFALAAVVAVFCLSGPKIGPRT